MAHRLSLNIIYDDLSKEIEFASSVLNILIDVSNAERGG